VPACYWEEVTLRVFGVGEKGGRELVLISRSQSRILIFRPTRREGWGSTKPFSWGELRAFFDRNKEPLAIETKQVQ
jgi:hypothetical protein